MYMIPPLAKFEELVIIIDSIASFMVVIAIGLEFLAVIIDLIRILILLLLKARYPKRKHRQIKIAKVMDLKGENRTKLKNSERKKPFTRFTKRNKPLGLNNKRNMKIERAPFFGYKLNCKMIAKNRKRPDRLNRSNVKKEKETKEKKLLFK